MGDSEPIIQVENLGKKYLISHQQEGRGRYQSLRDTLMNGLRAAGRRLVRPFARTERPGKEEFWALKDVSFEVKRGEVVGIIGRNGAGKSTLLKILSRITEPTTGRVTLRGRVASLLEVGTGFHPELTGRENVYLNGAILGMSRAEIKKKFDEIVAFAEVEKFLDTPVKRYSSGMYMRLAFAVAAHLEPEILVVDEVLAVGDAGFQKKCLGKMGEVARGGRTVLLVSHNMVAIGELCQRCLWLEGGKLRESGATGDVVRAYSRVSAEAAEKTIAEQKVRGDGRVKLKGYRVANTSGECFPLPVTNEDVHIEVELEVLEEIRHTACGVHITNRQGVLLTSINTVEMGITLDPFLAGRLVLRITLGRVPYLAGTYNVTFWVMSPQGHIFAYAEDAINFEIGQSPVYGTSQVDHRWGCVYTKVDFLPIAGSSSNLAVLQSEFKV